METMTMSNEDRFRLMLIWDAFGKMTEQQKNALVQYARGQIKKDGKQTVTERIREHSGK